MKEKELRLDHLIFGFGLVVLVSCVFLSFPFIGYESALMLITFNFLYVFLTFPLNGKLSTKFCMLLIGNIIGLFWNYIFSLFAFTSANYLGELFNVLYIILGPFINLVWFVSFWSTSLTVLASSETERQRFKLDN